MVDNPKAVRVFLAVWATAIVVLLPAVLALLARGYFGFTQDLDPGGVGFTYFPSATSPWWLAAGLAFGAMVWLVLGRLADFPESHVKRWWALLWRAAIVFLVIVFTGLIVAFWDAITDQSGIGMFTYLLDGWGTFLLLSIAPTVLIPMLLASALVYGGSVRTRTQADGHDAAAPPQE